MARTDLKFSEYQLAAMREDLLQEGKDLARHAENQNLVEEYLSKISGKPSSTGLSFRGENLDHGKVLLETEMNYSI